MQPAPVYALSSPGRTQTLSNVACVRQAPHNWQHGSVTASLQGLTMWFMERALCWDTAQQG